MARKDWREAIFHTEDDRQILLETLGETTARTGWLVHAWVLMSNHYHLLIETPEPNLVKAERMVRKGLREQKLLEQSLPVLAKGDKRKAIIASNVRRQTAVPLQIARDIPNWSYISAIRVRAFHSHSTFDWRETCDCKEASWRGRCEWTALKRGITSLGGTSGRRFCEIERRASVSRSRGESRVLEFNAARQ
ncbi:MAG: transposase [Verrucomicrobiales bacterium]